MTRKHFEAIAAILRDRRGYNLSTIDFDNGYNAAVDALASDLADLFETENPRFDRDRFIAAVRK